MLPAQLDGFIFSVCSDQVATESNTSPLCLLLFGLNRLSFLLCAIYSQGQLGGPMLALLQPINIPELSCSLGRFPTS